MALPPMVARGLRRSFDAVPRHTRTTTTYDWHSEPGERFLQHVEAAMQGGATLDQIGQLLGVTGFAQRYRRIKRWDQAQEWFR